MFVILIYFILFLFLLKFFYLFLTFFVIHLILQEVGKRILGESG